MAHLSYCLLSVLSLCSHKYYKGDFRHELHEALQQRGRATKTGQPCTPPFPSSSFTSTVEPSSGLICSPLKCQHASNGSQDIYCCSFFSSNTTQQTYQQYGLCDLPRVDSSQECSPGATLAAVPQLVQGTTPRPGVELPTGTQWTHTQIPPQDWMYFRTQIKIILPITVCSAKFSRNGWLNNCAHMYTVNPDLFYLATQ